MGAQSAHAPILDPHFLSRLALATPLSTLDPAHTEVHQLLAHSPQQLALLLDRVRAKKHYDCPHLVKIIDSHTIESTNICSTVIRTYIVVEKPQSLVQEVQQRQALNLGFS